MFESTNVLVRSSAGTLWGANAASDANEACEIPAVASGTSVLSRWEDDIILVCCKVSAREFGGRWVWPEASLASCESVKAREEGSVRASNRREVVDDTS